MRIISFIKNKEAIRAILKHLGLCLVRACPGLDPGSRPPPKIHAPPVCLPGTDRRATSYGMDDVSQLTINDDHLYRDPEYSWDDYIQA